ncbi:glycerol-3-phosphate 1-O-acyltransferase PlsY [Alsobacter sp. R-9]
MFVTLAAALVLGYLLGSIPFGLLLTRLAGTQDLRSIGSGNIGATNVLRTGRKDLAAATLVGDALKGTAAVLIAARWGEPAALAGAIGAFAGHLFPVWLGFKGGKGVATFLGTLIGLAWPVAAGFAAIWIGMAYAFRYSSLSALVASAMTPVLLAFVGRWQAAVVYAVLAAALWWKHSENISRLRAGREHKIGAKKE